MNRAIAILLIIVFSYHFVGSWMTFKALQYRVRKEIKHKIKNAVPLSEQVVFQEQSLLGVEWVKPKKEFRLKDGSMYDVIRKQGSIYYCIRDTQEEQLFKYLDEMVSQQIHHSSSKNTLGDKVFKSFKPDFTLDYSINLQALTPIDLRLYIPFRKIHNPKVDLSIPSPPPRL